MYTARRQQDYLDCAFLEEGETWYDALRRASNVAGHTLHIVCPTLEILGFVFIVHNYIKKKDVIKPMQKVHFSE